MLYVNKYYDRPMIIYKGKRNALNIVPPVNIDLVIYLLCGIILCLWSI